MTIIDTFETFDHGKAQILNLVYLMPPLLCSAIFKMLLAHIIIYPFCYTSLPSPLLSY